MKGPVCLLDMGDNVGGGSPGDSTSLAHAIHERGLAHAFICLCDPESVERALRLEVGQRIKLSMGGRHDPKAGPPLVAECELLGIYPGRFQERHPRHGGFATFDQGPTAIVRTSRGLTIMLTSRRVPPWSMAQLESCGLDPSTFHCLVAKGVTAPIAAYAEVCTHFIRVNTPGVTCADPSRFTYFHRRVPMFPFEAATDRNITVIHGSRLPAD